MFDEKGMLTDRARGILFWFTLAMIVIVAVGAIVTILRACSGLMAQVRPAPTITPAEVSLCPGEQQQFSVTGEEVTWTATGGLISQNGLFTAGNVLGDYTVTATARGSRRSAEAIVHIVACAPTATPQPSPTPAPTATPTPELGAIPPADAQGDVGAYDSGAPVAGVPAGVDISAASIAPDLRIALQPAEVPAELVGLAGEGDVLLWMTLYDPIPNPPTAYTDWIFALDVDGNTATGRPPNSATAINPDVGEDVAVGLNYDVASGIYEPYLLVWRQGNWQNIPNGVRAYKIGDSRTVVGFAILYETLQQATQSSGINIVLDAVKGRAVVRSYVADQKVGDFYPNRHRP